MALLIGGLEPSGGCLPGAITSVPADFLAVAPETLPLPAALVQMESLSPTVSIFYFPTPLGTRILMLGSVSWSGPMSVSQCYHVSFKHMASGFILGRIWMPFMASGRERLISLFGI